MSWLFEWRFSRDRLGRLRCGKCGLCCSKQTMDYGDEGIEVQYVCIHCFAEGHEAWIPERFAIELYPDWNKRWRDKLKAIRTKRKKIQINMNGEGELNLYQRLLRTEEGARYHRNKIHIQATCEYIQGFLNHNRKTQYWLALKYKISRKSIRKHLPNILRILHDTKILSKIEGLPDRLVKSITGVSEW